MKKIVLHNTFNITSVEISLNALPTSANFSFVRAYKEYEEIYDILSGKEKSLSMLPLLVNNNYKKFEMVFF